MTACIEDFRKTAGRVTTMQTIQMRFAVDHESAEPAGSEHSNAAIALETHAETQNMGSCNYKIVAEVET